MKITHILCSFWLIFFMVSCGEDLEMRNQRLASNAAELKSPTEIGVLPDGRKIMMCKIRMKDERDSDHVYFVGETVTSIRTEVIDDTPYHHVSVFVDGKEYQVKAEK